MVRFKLLPRALLAGLVVAAGSTVIATPGDESTLSVSQREAKARAESSLARAKEKFREKVEKARAPVLEKIKGWDDLARDRVDIASVERLKVERGQFLDEGIMPGKLPAADYLKAIETARTELLKAYDASIRELLIARVDDEVKGLVAQKEQLKGDRATVYKLMRGAKELAEKKPAAAPPPPVPPPVPAVTLDRADRPELPKADAGPPPFHDIDLNLPLRKDFRVINGTWFLDGQDLVEGEEAGENVLLVAGEWENYDFQTRIMMIRGSRGIGVVMHYADKANYDRVLLGANGGSAIIVEMFRNSERTVLREVPLKPAFHQNTWYDMQVRVRGPQLVVYVNGREIFRQLDNAFSRGGVGFSAPWGTVPRFRDIEILSTDGLANFRGLPLLRRW